MCNFLLSYLKVKYKSLLEALFIEKYELNILVLINFFYKKRSEWEQMQFGTNSVNVNLNLI